MFTQNQFFNHINHYQLFMHYKKRHITHFLSNQYTNLLIITSTKKPAPENFAGLAKKS